MNRLNFLLLKILSVNIILRHCRFFLKKYGILDSGTGVKNLDSQVESVLRMF